jgi:hypothetical protein
MTRSDLGREQFSRWIEALDERYLADLTRSEVARALRALSSCYVERRDRLAAGEALRGAGKRAAFALFYAPLHFMLVQEVVRALGLSGVREVLDLGCGTGAAGAAWALEAGGVPVAGVDRSSWAVAESAWTYRQLGLRGKASRADVGRLSIRPRSGSAVVAAYTVNELQPSARASLLPQLVAAARRHGGAQILIVEPIARRHVPWWDDWAAAFVAAGGRAEEWRFPASLPSRQAELARAAGLDPRELTARSLSLAPRVCGTKTSELSGGGRKPHRPPEDRL